MKNCTDYYLYDKANDALVRFDNGDIIFYGDKDEAEKDCYGNEYIVQYKDLNKKHKLKIVDQKVTSFSKGGLSITFILASSNLLVHTWPELNSIHFDIVTCSPIYEKNNIPKTLKNLFKTSKIEFNVIE